jgi:hypothetical protein
MSGIYLLHRDVAVNNACRAAFNALLGFLGTHLR